MRPPAERVRRAALAVLCLGLLTAFRLDPSGDARRDAGRFILEKLERRAGDTWERSGQHFIWDFRFSPNGCELTVERSARDRQAVFVQRLPMADLAPQALGDGALRFACSRGDDCITFQDLDGTRLRRGGRGSTMLPVMQPDDQPKLLDAFLELHRLCDDAYRP